MWEKWASRKMWLLQWNVPLISLISYFPALLMLDRRRFSSGGGRSAAESRRLARKDWPGRLPAGVKGRLEHRNNATWFLPLISRGPGCHGNHSAGPNISGGCKRSFRKRALASFHLWGGVFFCVLFFYGAVTERWAWLVRGGHVTGKYRNDKQPQIGLTWGRHPSTAESLASVSLFTLHSFTSLVYYLSSATWRLDKWINSTCWYTHLTFEYSVCFRECV